MAVRPDKNPKAFLPVPAGQSRKVSWNCYYAAAIGLKLKDGQFSSWNISTYLEKSVRLHLENREKGVDVEIQREDLADTSPKFPFYHKRITITELKSYEYKPPLAIQEPKDYQRTGVRKVKVTNDTDRQLFIAFKDTNSAHQERITLNPKATGTIQSKNPKHIFATSGDSFFLGCCGAQSDEEFVYYHMPIKVEFDKKSGGYDCVYIFEVKFGYDSASGAVTARIIDNIPKDNCSKSDL